MREFPIVEEADRPLVKALAIELIRLDGWTASPAIFEWIEWSEAKIRFDGDRVSVRSVGAVEKALLLLPVIKTYYGAKPCELHRGN